MKPKLTKRSEDRDNPEVLIIRSGYRTDDQWLDAILKAQELGRRVVIITADGKRQVLT